MFFEKNIQAMQSAHAESEALVRKIAAAPEISGYEILGCPDGNFTLTYKGMPLHDPQGPIAEAQKVIRHNAALTADRVHVLLGLGLGYLLDEICQKSPGQIIVYEPDLALLKFVLENVDLSHLLSQERVLLFADQLEFLTGLRKKLYGQYKLDILTLRGCAYLLANEVESLMSQITRIELYRVQDFKTGKHFHTQWINQFFENYPQFAALPTLDCVANRFEGKPALVISRGPSLDAALPHVKTLRDCAVLIAVGGALHRLHSEGIVPDFALFYDANGMRQQVHGLPDDYLAQITFVMSPFTQPDVFEMPSRGKLLMLGQNNNQLAAFMDQALSHEHLRLPGGGTVSIMGFQMAQAMGCNPVILVGQDLAFPNNQVYAGGIAVQLNEKGQLDLQPTETLHAKPYDMDTVPGQDGQPLQTLQSYKSFLIHLEEMAQANADSPEPLTLWNASLGGAQINGFPVRNLAEFVDELPAWKTSYALPQAPGYSQAEIQSRQQALLNAVKATIQELKAHLQFIETIGVRASRIYFQESEQANAMLALTSEFFGYFARHDFAAYWLIHEIQEYRERFQATLSLPDGPAQAQKEVKTLCNAASKLLSNQILPSLENAALRLESEPLPTASV